MTPEVSTGDPTKLMCLRCARRAVSPRSIGRFDGLRRYLNFRAAFTSVVKIPLAKMDGIIRDNLPMSAFREKEWWSNSSSSKQTRAWLDAGWEVQEVNLSQGYVVFHKRKHVGARGTKRKRERVKKPFTPAPYRVRRRKTSKTKAAKLYARIKNLERRRSIPRKYRGSLKPKPAQEKRMYRPGEKPE